MRFFLKSEVIVKKFYTIFIIEGVFLMVGVYFLYYD